MTELEKQVEKGIEKGTTVGFGQFGVFFQKTCNKSSSTCPKRSRLVTLNIPRDPLGDSRATKGFPGGAKPWGRVLDQIRSRFNECLL